MIRKQIYIEKEQDEELKLLSSRLGVSEAELFRRGIELVKRDSEDSEAKKSGERLVEMMRARAAKLPEGGGTGKVSRDDIYYERLSRHLH